jgi:hypothetical protein
VEYTSNQGERTIRQRRCFKEFIIGGIQNTPETRKFLKSGIAQDTDSSVDASGIHAGLGRGWKSFRRYFSRESSNYTDKYESRRGISAVANS